jgi:hypothetical protein
MRIMPKLLAVIFKLTEQRVKQIFLFVSACRFNCSFAWKICLHRQFRTIYGSGSSNLFLLWAQKCLNPTLGLAIRDPFQPGAFLPSRVTIIICYERRADDERYIALECAWEAQGSLILDWFNEALRTALFLQTFTAVCWGSDSGAAEDSNIVVCCTIWTRKSLPTFRRIVAAESTGSLSPRNNSQAGICASLPSPALTLVFLGGYSSCTARPWRWRHNDFSKRG